MQPIVVVAGPTSSGKSELAIKIAKENNGVILNADSRQVYKELKIATSQPIPQEINDSVWILNGIEHYLYGYVSVNEEFNLFRYQQDAMKLISSLQSRGKTPIMVGGTGLYIDSVVLSYNLAESRKEQPLNHRYIVLNVDKEMLKARIENKVNEMFANGLVEENIALWKSGVDYTLPALKTIGYREFFDYFTQDKSLTDIKNEILKHTTQYAKRQRTWFRRHKHALIFDMPGSPNDLSKLFDFINTNERP